MIPFLPPPQELRYTTESFRFTGREQLFLSPWDGEDATEEVLCAALQPLGGACPASPMALPAPGEAQVLAIATDESAAQALAQRALNGLNQKVATPTVCRDGPCFPDETTQARRLAAPLKPARPDEEYSLFITAGGIAIAGRSRQALFWGVQTLAQALEHVRREELPHVPGLQLRDWPTLRLRGLHLDMKYLHQRPDAIEEWLRQLAVWKVNTVLFEYEDKFPYQRYPFLRHPDAMTPEQLRHVLDVARRHHIQVIPLIQSLGHLEYCLKHEELAHLRETPEITSQANPLDPASLRFVLEMIDEVLECHPDAEFFHVGGDEASFLGVNPQSWQALQEKGVIGLYLDHMVPVLEHIIAAGKRPILWDDILRVQAEHCARIPRETVLAYWDYSPVRAQHGEREVPDVLRDFYQLDSKRLALWPATLGSFPFFDFYRQQGFDVLAAPCCNYATLVPDDAHNFPNTLLFTEKAINNGGLGVLNTQWACFKTPFDVMWQSYALTAHSAWLYPPADLTDFDSDFSRGVLGEESGLLVRANRLIAMGVGFRAPGVNRMLNLLHFAFMDAELNFDGGIKERQQRGSAVHELDFNRIMQRKLAALAMLEQKPDLLARLRRVEAELEAALRLLDCAAPTTPRGRATLQQLRGAARFKLTRAATMRLLMGEASSFASAQDALRAEEQSRAELRELYGRTVAPAELEYEMRLLFEGEMNALRTL